METDGAYCYICGTEGADDKSLTPTNIISLIEYILQITLVHGNSLQAIPLCNSCNQKLALIEELISEIKESFKPVTSKSEISQSKSSKEMTLQKERKEPTERKASSPCDSTAKASDAQKQCSLAVENINDSHENTGTENNNVGSDDEALHSEEHNSSDDFPSLDDDSVEKVTKKRRLSYTCGCGEACDTIRTLQIHREKNHGGGVVCKDCGITLMTPKDLNQHSLVHKKDAFNCGVCGVGFRKALYLQNHQRMSRECSKAMDVGYADLDVRTLRECGCGEKFPNTEALKKHRMKKHLGKFICSECSRQFGTIGSLRRHMFFHKEGKFECQECGEMFRHPAYLQTHQRRFHSPRAQSATERRKPGGNRIPRATKITHNLRQLRLNPVRRKRASRETLKRSVEENEEMKDEVGDAYSDETVDETKEENIVLDTDTKITGNHVKVDPASHDDMSDDPEGRDPTLEMPEIACAVCDVTYKTEASLLKHITAYHWENSQDSRNFTCKICTRAFPQISDMAKHARSHRDEMHKCKECDSVFSKKEHLIEHGFQIHKKDAKPLREFPRKCQFCTKEAPSRSLLSLHCLTDHGQHASFGLVSPRDRPHECSFCPMSFNSRRDLQKHITKHARALRDKTAFMFSCEECLKKCKTQAGLEKHQKQFCPGKEGVYEDEMGNVRRSFVCELCEAFYKTRSSYELHLSKHTGEGQHECEICQQKFRMKAHLTKHLAGHNRPFMCAQCGKQFSTANHLKEHQAIHTTDLNHVCSVCNEKFRWRLSLVRHLWRQHNMGNAPKTYRKLVQCKICEAEVSRNGRADHFEKQHKDMPYSPKQFRCLECKTSSSRRISTDLTTKTTLPNRQNQDTELLYSSDKQPSSNAAIIVYNPQTFPNHEAKEQTPVPSQSHDFIESSNNQTSKSQLVIHHAHVAESISPYHDLLHIPDPQRGTTMHQGQQQPQIVSGVPQGSVMGPTLNKVGDTLTTPIHSRDVSFDPASLQTDSNVHHEDILPHIQQELRVAPPVETSTTNTVSHVSKPLESPLTSAVSSTQAMAACHQGQFQNIQSKTLHPVKFPDVVTASSSMNSITTQLNTQTETVEQMYLRSFSNLTH